MEREINAKSGDVRLTILKAFELLVRIYCIQPEKMETKKHWPCGGKSRKEIRV